MADLPINIADIITPYHINVNEITSLVVSANSKSRMIRSGSQYFSMEMGIKPRNMMRHPDEFWRIATFLQSNPTFSAPMHNMQASKFAINEGLTLQSTNVTSGAAIGATRVAVSSSQNYNAGQYVKFGSRTKVYQVTTADSTYIYLSTPLRQVVGQGDLCIWREDGWNGETFDGIMGLFNNEDFGNPSHKIEDGIMGTFNNLVLREVI